MNEDNLNLIFTLAIGTVASRNVLSKGPLPRRGIAAAWPGAPVRLLPRVPAVVGVRVLLRRRSIAAARPGARERPQLETRPIQLAHGLRKGIRQGMVCERVWWWRMPFLGLPTTGTGTKVRAIDS